jgi:hypothetical protein
MDTMEKITGAQIVVWNISLPEWGIPGSPEYAGPNILSMVFLFFFNSFSSSATEFADESKLNRG